MGNLNLLFTLIGAPAYRRPALMQSRQERAKKNPAFRRDFSALAWFTFELAILGRLLAGLLVRILVLLARIRVLVRHRRSPLLNVVGDNRKARHWFQADLGSVVIIAW
jgi:hypothetical protein